MTPPTPAAVRAAMKLSEYVKLTDEEKRVFLSDPRTESGILRDHIRAVAQEMRAIADSQEWYYEAAVAAKLRHFADKLEGLE